MTLGTARGLPVRTTWGSCEGESSPKASAGHKPSVLTAILFGIAASSALVIGAVVGSLWDPPREVTGVLLAFASGALISALAFELFEEA